MKTALTILLTLALAREAARLASINFNDQPEFNLLRTFSKIIKGGRHSAVLTGRPETLHRDLTRYRFRYHTLQARPWTELG